MTASFEWWRNALAGAFGPVHENDPQPGYYRMRDGKGGAFVPVAIWHDGSGINALRGGRPVDPCSVWTWCCREPIAYETYVAVAERGEPWPDAVPAIGHNSAAFGLAPPERLAADIADLWTAARDWLAAAGAIATQALADKAANFAERFAALGKAGRGAAHAGEAAGAGGRARHRCGLEAGHRRRKRGQGGAEAGARAVPAGRARAPRAGGRRPGRAAARRHRRAPHRAARRAQRARSPTAPRSRRATATMRGSGPARTSTRCCCGWPRTTWPPGGPSPAPSSSRPMSRPEGGCHDPCLCCRRACPDPCRRCATAGHRAAHARGGLAPGPGDRRLGPRPARPRHARGLPHRHPARARAGADAAVPPSSASPSSTAGRRCGATAPWLWCAPAASASGCARTLEGETHRGLERHLFGASGAARAGRSSAASACRMPGAPGCGAGRDRGASTRSACCRCGPAPLPCATPSPTCWAGSICARSWRTPTRADAGPAPRRCAHHRPPRPRPLPRLPTGRSTGPRHRRSRVAPAPVDEAVAAEEGAAADRMSPGSADPTGPVPEPRPMIPPQRAFCPLPGRRRGCGVRRIAPAPAAASVPARRPARPLCPGLVGAPAAHPGGTTAIPLARTAAPALADVGHRPAGRGHVGRCARTSSERRRPTSPQPVRPSPRPKRTQWPPPASRPAKQQARPRSRQNDPETLLADYDNALACARDQEVFAEIDEEFAPKLDGALARAPRPGASHPAAPRRPHCRAGPTRTRRGAP